MDKILSTRESKARKQGQEQPARKGFMDLTDFFISYCSASSFPSSIISSFVLGLGNPVKNQEILMLF